MNSTNNDNPLLLRIATSVVRGMGIDIAQKLFEILPDEKAFFEMPEQELKGILGGKSKIYQHDYRMSCIEKAEKELKFVTDNNINVTYYTDDNFPARMLNAPDAPILLYTLGKADLNSKHIISIVGTRRATEYGKRFTTNLVLELAKSIPDLVVVSGLAYGIDIAAHRAALKAGISTIAVQACGLNKIYPSEHRNDAIKIIRNNGMIVSDYTSQDDMHRGNFIARNRIIAALADCTVVVESAQKGGALITANIASSYDREVMALPGRVTDEFSAGCNRLIQNNQAAVITCADDLIKLMGWKAVNSEKHTELELFPQLTDDEQTIIDIIKQQGDTHINVITSKANLPVYRVMSALVELDCKGLVMTLPGCRYAIAKH